MEGVKENPDVEDIRAKRKTYKRRTGRNIAKFQGAVKGREKNLFFFLYAYMRVSAYYVSRAEKGQGARFVITR